MSPLRRTMDAGLLNRVVNHPDVRPLVGPGQHPLDLTGLVQDPRNLALVNDHGGFVFLHDEPGRYELHTMFLPEGRGAAVLDAASVAFRMLFVETDCAEIVTKTTESNRAAALMARKAGFRLLFSRDGGWVPGERTDYFTLTLDEWRGHDPEVATEGEAFHAMLEGAKQRCGSELVTHPDDPAHDRAAGAACLMAKAGNGPKAVWTYNRWARFAGYQTIELKSASPLVIDVRDALITARAGKLEVLQCR